MPILALALGVTAAATLAWQWGPPRYRWSLVDVFSAFALFVGLSGLCGSALARLWGGSWVPQATELLPGLVGTAIASVLVSAMILRRARRGALGVRLAAGWAWGVGLAGIPAFLLVSAAWAGLVEWVGIPFESQHLLQALGKADAAEQVMALGYGVLAAPLVEELLFRGFLLPPVERRLGLVNTCIIAGMLFGLAHMSDPLAVVPLTLLGIALSWLRLRSGSIWPGVMVHVGNNAVAMGVGLLVG